MQLSDVTILFAISLLKLNVCKKPTNVENFLLLNLYSDIWSQLIIDVNLLKYCNELKVCTSIVVTSARREQLIRWLREPEHQNYNALH